MFGISCYSFDFPDTEERLDVFMGPSGAGESSLMEVDETAHDSPKSLSPKVGDTAMNDHEAASSYSTPSFNGRMVSLNPPRFCDSNH